MKLKNFFKRKSSAAARQKESDRLDKEISRQILDLEQQNSNVSNKAAPVNSPYLNARRNWNDNVSSFVTASQLWQFVGIASLLIALASVGGLIYISTQSKFIPYVVEVDQLGQLRNAGVATSTVSTDDRILKAIAANFIENARLVTPDVTLQRKAIFSVYAHIASNDPALNKINEWYNSTPAANPLARAANEMVSTSITSILQQTKNVFQIDWVETTRDRNGNMIGKPVSWRALVTVYAPTKVDLTGSQTMYDNPLSIYIKDFSWQRLQD